MNRVSGFATPEGTEAYAERHRPVSYNMLGTMHLTVSAAGFGGYRVDASVKDHARALEKALTAGINVIDTSANYADGGSERMIGGVLGELTTSGAIARNEVVVVSKAGYLQGGNFQLSQERKARHAPFPDLVVLGQDLEHCIHPEFLEDQLGRSLDRLRLETLDCFLLHNPEYYLNWAEKNGVSLEEARLEYYRRIRKAFVHLEAEAAAGRIRSYGISSNTFPASPADYNATSLAAVWEIACSISSQHHFRVIEFPLNLLETGAILRPQGEDTLLELAVACNLGVMVNRPLNAIVRDRLVRLAENHYSGDGLQQARHFRDKVAAIDQDWTAAQNLSQLAFRVLRSTTGISTVLIGMRHEKYVEDVLDEIGRPCSVGARQNSWAKIEAL